MAKTDAKTDEAKAAEVEKAAQAAKAAEAAKAVEAAEAAARAFRAKHNIVLDGVTTPPGGTVDLTREIFELLKPQGSIDGDWD